ncbi:MAG: hypothetical protein SWX82_05135, partial [Cyanobacteriota bacterium]|nr:hypothetical protein [Cyanobacteriota bacterium]
AKPPENIQENTKIEIYENQIKTTPEWFQPDKKNFPGVIWAEEERINKQKVDRYSNPNQLSTPCRRWGIKPKRKR